MAPYILSAPDVQSNEVQPRAIKTLRVPDYFAEYRDKGDGLAAFLGTSIIAKVRETFVARAYVTLTRVISHSSHSTIRLGRTMYLKRTTQARDLVLFWA